MKLGSRVGVRYDSVIGEDATMPDVRPIAVQVTVTVTALVYAETEAGGFSAEVQALPGCYTEGETLDKVRDNLKEAAEAWLAAKCDAKREYSVEACQTPPNPRG